VYRGSEAGAPYAEAVPLRRALIVCLAALGAAAASAPASAQGTTTRCLGGQAGPVCHVWYGTVRSVNDGDTVDVDLDGDGSRRVYAVRLSSVQAMELTRYHPKRRRGACSAVAATERVEELVRAGRRRVRLTAQDPASRADVRLRRFVAVKIGGRWRDIGERLMAEGHTLLLAGIVEHAFNGRYNLLGQQAAARGAGIWNPVRCGRGPSRDVPLRVWANWDPSGVDAEHVNDEWIKVQNLSSTTPLPLAGWWLRDSQLRRFTFPPGTVVAPRDTVTLHAGHGASTATRLFWGIDRPIFENAGDARDLGDGAYLFDPKGDLRASMVYPCLVACTDPNQGAIEVGAQPRGQEYVRLRNVAGRPVDLYGYRLATRADSYAFGPASVLEPGEVMQIDAEGDPSADTPRHRYWGLQGRRLADAGGTARLMTFSGVVLACDAWGSESC
jgi:endonuclease YncB( thermonuclease family)